MARAFPSPAHPRVPPAQWDRPRRLPAAQVHLGPAGDRPLQQQLGHLQGPGPTGGARGCLLEQQEGPAEVDAGSSGLPLPAQLWHLQALRHHQEGEASATDYPHRCGSLLSIYSADLCCEQLLPRKDHYHVAEEWAGGGQEQSDVHTADPEWRLDLLHPSDAGGTAKAWRCLCLPSGACQLPRTHQHPVGATVGLSQEQDVDRSGGAPAGPGLCGAWSGSVPEEQERDCYPTTCSTHQLNCLDFIRIQFGEAFLSCK